MKKLYIFIILSLLTVTLKCQVDGLITNIQNIYEENGKFFIKAALIEGQAKDLVLETINVKEEDFYWDELDFGVNDLSNEKIDSFIYKLAKLTTTLDNKQDYLNDITKLCEIKRTIEMPYLYQDTDFSEFTEIVWLIDETKHLIEKHIYVEGQYWGSLSSSQMNQVFYELIIYIFKLNDTEQLCFFKKFFDTVCQIAKE